jgi:hypothetical protein
MSPRCTHALHERGDLKHLASVLVIGLKSGDLGSQLRALPEAAGAVEDRAANSFRSAEAGRLKLRERLQSFGVQADADSR